MKARPLRAAVLHLTPTRGAGLVALLALFGVPFVETAVLHRLGALTSAVVWAALLLASFAGWGALANDFISPNRRADAGLRMAWGVAVTTWIGGVLLLGHAGSRGPLTVMIALGLVALALDGSRRLPTRQALARRIVRRSFSSWPVWVFVVAVCPLVVVQIAGEAADLNLNPADDLLAYLAFPKEMLQAGTFFQPFSFRRIGSYGGQSFLQALFLLGTKPEQAYALDRGVCLGLVVALIVGHARSITRPARVAVMLVALVVLTVPIVRTNTASAMSGVAIFVGLYRTIAWAGLPGRGDARAAIAIGAMTGLACTLRQNFIPVALGIVVTSGAISFVTIRGSWRDRIAAARDLAQSLVATVAFLAPWAILSFVSCRTLFFPVTTGAYNLAFGAVDRRQTLRQALEDLWPRLTTDSPTKTILLVALGALFLRDRGARPTVRPFLVASLVGVLLLLPQTDWDERRYRYGFEVAFFVVAALAAATELRSSRRGVTGGAWASVLVLVACAAQTMESRVGATTMYGQLLGWIEQPNTAPTTLNPSVEGAYIDAQASIPAGSKVLSVVDYPFYFDYRRGSFFNLDFPGIVSERPGIPWRRGPDALAAYLQNLSIRYVVFTDFNASVHMFKRATWEGHAKDPSSVWGHWAPYVLELLDSFDKLSATHRHLYEGSGLTVIDLAAPPDASTAPTVE